MTMFPPISCADYLSGEAKARRKSEYVDGIAYAMAGGNNRHNGSASGTLISLGEQLRGKISLEEQHRGKFSAFDLALGDAGIRPTQPSNSNFAIWRIPEDQSAVQVVASHVTACRPFRSHV